MRDDELEIYKLAFEEFNSILDVSFDGITIANGDGVFTRISKSCEELFGVKRSEIIGHSAFILEEKGIFDVSVTCEVIKTKKRVSIIQKTLAGRIILVTGTPILDKGGKIDKIINISRDITETKKLETELQLLETELEWFKHELNKRIGREKDHEGLYNSAVMRKIMEQINHVANLDATVLLLGETGVGKGFMANMVHVNSGRKDEPFIVINCGAIPENLLESELFGYERGSFTGASKDGKKGLFEIAGNGTIFLDEIGDMPLSLQVKLLHVLDEKKVRRIGGSTTFEVKARVIAATNKNLKELAKVGKFREDLFYRLNVVPITIPALRDRKEDLFPLISKLLKKTNNKYGTKKTLSDEALKLLHKYDYPGNIRELQNMIERLVINTFGETIESSKIHEVIEPTAEDKKLEIIPLKEAVEQLERSLLLSAFHQYKSTRKVAEVLKIDQSTVVKKAKKLNIKI
ncbi:sigma-54 interaction domain-containing protein [Ammoniphilus sp. 3BR4]|uniref:sigma-54 interaction domain-containing protein n=1 Tax=Ammoniphilus sp. 3BR4 TaxID=3158265 RepID=UPI0034667719